MGERNWTGIDWAKVWGCGSRGNGVLCGGNGLDECISKVGKIDVTWIDHCVVPVWHVIDIRIYTSFRRTNAKWRHKEKSATNLKKSQNDDQKN